MIKFDILNRFTGSVQFTAEIDCSENAERSVKIGLAVRWGLKSRADLSRANLSGADLSRADLSGANFSGADLSGADLSGAKSADLVIARTRILPEGDIIGWKKCQGDVIAKLLIPAAAKRSHAFGRKCRAEYVDCLELFGADKGISLHDGKTEYAAGQRVTPDAFDENWQSECSSGIHFYITRAEAEVH